MKAYFFKHNLEFNNPAKTSRDVLYKKPTWFIVIENQNKIGIGECSIIPGLSIDKLDGIESKLEYICRIISLEKNLDPNELIGYPAVKFALETAQKDLVLEKLLIPISIGLGLVIIVSILGLSLSCHFWTTRWKYRLWKPVGGRFM